MIPWSRNQERRMSLRETERKTLATLKRECLRSEDEKNMIISTCPSWTVGGVCLSVCLQDGQDLELREKNEERKVSDFGLTLNLCGFFTEN